MLCKSSLCSHSGSFLGFVLEVRNCLVRLQASDLDFAQSLFCSAFATLVHQFFLGKYLQRALVD